MPEFVHGDATIYDEVSGEGFPLRVLAPGGLDSTIVASSRAAIDPLVHREDLRSGVLSYEAELREYATRNEEAALHRAPPRDGAPAGPDDAQSGSVTRADGVPDWGQMTVPLTLRRYRVTTAL